VKDLVANWEPVTNQDVSKTRLNQTAPEGIVEVFSRAQGCLPQPSRPVGCLFPPKGFTASFPLLQFKSGYWLQNAKGEHPPEPAPDFTLPWVERFRAQCTPLVLASTKMYNTPPSGRCTPGYELKGYQLHTQAHTQGRENDGDRNGLLGMTNTEEGSSPWFTATQRSIPGLGKAGEAPDRPDQACAHNDTEAMPVE
jgi:hypothetical protein